jgi:hypothetical protein
MLIRDMDPPAGKTYLKRIGVDGSVEAPFEPFGEEWGLERSQFRWTELLVSDLDIKRLEATAEDADPAITVSLDKAVNGTSLVLVFEVGDAVLLFPGDAQWGTWRTILSDEGTRELIGRATFLKVGHHGSHNATPKEYVEEVLRAGCCAMMSTKTGKWDSIPRGPLLAALKKKTKAFARSDQMKEAESPFVLRTKSFTEAEIPTKT